MKSPLSFKSQSTWAIIFFGFLGGLVVLEYYLPKDPTTQYLAAGGALSILGIGIAYSAIGARLKGPPHPHAIVTGRIYPSGNPQQKDFFFANADPVKRVIDVVPLGEVDETTGEERPVRVQGRDIYPYLARTEWGVDWYGLGTFYVHIFVLSDPWNQFFGTHRREMGAYILGEVIDHGNSDCVTVYVAPFVHEYLGEEIPLYYGVEGTSTYKKVTRSWQPTLRVVARMPVDKVIQDHKEDIWPAKELEEIVDEQLEKQKIIISAAIARKNAGKKK